MVDPIAERKSRRGIPIVQIQRFMEDFMRKVFGLMAIAGALMVSACNTVEGAGRDVSSAGDAVSDAASDSK